MKKALTVAVVTLAALVFVTAIYTKGVRQDYETSQANVKAYDGMLGEKVGEIRALRLTVDQLGRSNDSILRSMDSLRKAEKIKGKNVKAMHYTSSVMQKTDTVVLRDTVLSGVSVDTVVGDAWYSLRLRLEAPNRVVVSPKFTSQKHVIVHVRKETVNPPKKCWLLRLFQRKHKVAVVTVRERNPYIRDSVSRFVEVSE